MATPVSPVNPEIDDRSHKIYREICSRPLVALDDAIACLAEHGRHLDEKRESRLLNLFARAALRAVGHSDALELQQPLDQLFSTSLSSQARKEVAVFLVRLITDAPDVIKRPEMSTRLGSLFDDVFRDSLYRIAKLEISDQAYRKFQEITSVVSKLEADLVSMIDHVVHIQEIQALKSSFLKKINSGLARIVIHPFLPEYVREEHFLLLLSQVELYTSASGPSIVSAYQQVRKSADMLAAVAKQIGTRFAIRFSASIAERVANVVQAHFEQTPFSKQAALLLEASDKKYPLQILGAPFNLSVTLTNEGPGYAFDVQVRIKSHAGEIEFKTTEVTLGGIQPSQAIVEFPAQVSACGESLMAEIECSWRTFDSAEHHLESILEFKSQRTGIDWDRAATEDPYSLAPVESATDLFGRADILNRLLALTKGTAVESAFLRGQKRVGKTSIVKTLQSRLLQLFPADYIIVYLEAGDYIAHDGKQTVQLLGDAICQRVRNADKRLQSLRTPDFSAGLATLNTFLQDVIAQIPTCRILFILDEFDELPLELYRKGLVGDAFFRTIRSISNKSAFGFVLVGSEKMEYVLSSQGDALNKFERFSVDYFDKQRAWGDFQDLVKRPGSRYLDFSEAAVVAIYDASAGNPYFAKLICRTLFFSMIKRRDCYVTPREVEDAVSTTLAEIGSNSFAHFWQDGIAEPPPRSEEISIFRRKVLLSVAECVRRADSFGTGVSQETVVQAARAFQLLEPQVVAELREFERRQVLVNNEARYFPKVSLFARWLVEKGYQEIITTLLDRDALLQLKKQEEADRVKEEEIAALVHTWDLYLGQRITPEYVRAWLNQFQGAENQRLAFKILCGIRFYSADKIRQKLREAHGIVTRQIVWERKARQPKRRDLIVSALGGLAHSGAEYARRYADENQIYPENVVGLDELSDLVNKRADELKGIVFVDDFIGTGETLAKTFETLSPSTVSVLRTEGVLVWLLVVTGFRKGVLRVEESIAAQDLPVSIHICDPLDEGDMLFSDKSKVFSDPMERARAKDMAYECGVAVLPDAPFGYGDCQAAVVFESKIPNNCLPILWRATKTWKPLFKRN